MNRLTEITLDGIPYQVDIIRKPIKNMYLRIKGKQHLQVTCPRRLSDERIRMFIMQKQDWIRKTAAKQDLHEVMNREGVNGPFIWWLGERKYVRCETAAGDRMEISGDIITFYLKEVTDTRIQKTFRRYAGKAVLELAAKHRSEWDREICLRNHITPPEITVKHMKSRWGYCVPREHRITLNMRLIHYSEEALEYILLHEYAHFLVQDHSAAFYAVIRHYMPQYKAYEALLKQ